MSTPALQPATDRDLARAVLEDGDERAFRTLYRRHTPFLLAFVTRVLGGDGTESEDAIQETWIRAVGALGRFRWDASLRTWLTGIALNAARERLRRSGRRRAREEADPAPTRQRPDSVAERIDLERAIAELPDGYRTVFVLHDLHGFSHEEIAERLDIAAVTSRSQLHRARRTLRSLLNPPTLVNDHG